MVRSIAVAVGAVVVFSASVAGATDCVPPCGWDVCPPAGVDQAYLATVTDVSSHGMTLRVDDTFGSFGVREGDEIFVGPDGTVGDRYFVVVDVNSRPQRLRVDGAGLVHLCGGYERIPVERAASIALASNCYEEAKKEGLMAECPDGSGCSSGSGGPAVLTAGAVAALFAALRSRRRMIP